MKVVALIVVAASLVLTGCAGTIKSIELADSQVLGASASHDRWKETVPGADKFGRTAATFRRLLSDVEGEVALRNAALLCPALASELLSLENFENVAEVYWAPSMRSTTGYSEFKPGARYVLIPAELRSEVKQLKQNDGLVVRLPSKQCAGVMQVTGVRVKAS